MSDRRPITATRIAQRLLAFVLVAALAAPYVPSVRAATSCACVAAALGQTGVSRGCCEAPPAIAAGPFVD
jgi:hypothetical protein